MKKLNEFKSRLVRIFSKGKDGGMGEIEIGSWKGTVIWSTGAGWNHVSVSPYNEFLIPSWNDMCQVKDIFFNDNESVIQIHPPKNMYVDNMNNCLHLWSCTYKEMILPPSVLVGVRKGQTREEYDEELREAYKEAGEEFPE